jgi:hypothetical protein
VDTVEEAIVVKESKKLVDLATKKLNQINPNIISLQVSKNSARLILFMQESMIENFISEGFILL